MKIKSPAFKDGQYIPEKYTCDGNNINPPLEFFHVPRRAKSLVLIIDSPELPSSDPTHDWVHWFVWNIGPSTSRIAENSFPKGAHIARSNFFCRDYRGPCPPAVGVHRYQLKLYALDEKIKLPASADMADVRKKMKKHIIEHAILIGLYERKI